MDIEQLREYCIAKKGVTEHFPFDDVPLVFKVMGKRRNEGEFKMRSRLGFSIMWRI